MCPRAPTPNASRASAAVPCFAPSVPGERPLPRGPRPLLHSAHGTGLQLPVGLRAATVGRPSHPAAVSTHVRGHPGRSEENEGSRPKLSFLRVFDGVSGHLATSAGPLLSRAGTLTSALRRAHPPPTGPQHARARPGLLTGRRDSMHRAPRAPRIRTPSQAHPPANVQGARRRSVMRLTQVACHTCTPDLPVRASLADVLRPTPPPSPMRHGAWPARRGLRRGARARVRGRSLVCRPPGRAYHPGLRAGTDTACPRARSASGPVLKRSSIVPLAFHRQGDTPAVPSAPCFSRTPQDASQGGL